MGIQTIFMALLSGADHWSDIILVGIWFTSDIPVIVPLQGLFFFSLTSIIPMLFYEEWYVKLAMPFGLGTYSKFSHGFRK